MNKDLNNKQTNNSYTAPTLNNDARELRDDARNEWEKAKEKGNEIWQGTKDEFDKGENEVKKDYEGFKNDL